MPAASAPSYGHIPLAEVTRGDLVESVHYGSFIAVDRDGSALLEGGQPAAPIYARSSLKPFQLTAMVRAGLDLPDDLLALGAASHNGEAIHTEGARRILEMHGLGVEALQNTPDYPIGASVFVPYLRASGEKTSLTQNCSGKHAAMLATCVVNGWDTENYLAFDHPLQRHIKATCEEMMGEASAADTNDGCGAPLFAFSLEATTRAFSRFGSAEEGSAERRIFNAYRRFPQMIAGDDRDDTKLMRAVPGLMTKGGAEAVLLIVLDGGTAVGLKVSDGGSRALSPVGIEILKTLGIEGAYDEVPPTPTLGHGKPVGTVRVIAGALGAAG